MQESTTETCGTRDLRCVSRVDLEAFMVLFSTDSLFWYPNMNLICTLLPGRKLMGKAPTLGKLQHWEFLDQTRLTSVLHSTSSMTACCGSLQRTIRLHPEAPDMPLQSAHRCDAVESSGSSKINHHLDFKISVRFFYPLVPVATGQGPDR